MAFDYTHPDNNEDSGFFISIDDDGDMFVTINEEEWYFDRSIAVVLARVLAAVYSEDD